MSQKFKDEEKEKKKGKTTDFMELQYINRGFKLMKKIPKCEKTKRKTSSPSLDEKVRKCVLVYLNLDWEPSG